MNPDNRHFEPDNSISRDPKSSETPEHFNVRDRLHTDVLEDKYGPIHAEVLRHDEEIREVYLSDAAGVARTHALTFFTPERWTPDVNMVNEAIKRGQPIGKAFRDSGYVVRKNVIGVGLLDLPGELRRAFQHPSLKAKARLSEFLARRESEKPDEYGIVLETYSPDFRPPEVNDIDQQQVTAPIEALQAAGFSLEEIWDRLGRDNDWTGVEERLIEARQAGATRLEELHRAVEQYFTQKNR